MISTIQTRRTTRAGFGLSETLLAMFLFTVALALFVAFLDQLLKLGSGGADHLDRLVVTGRLARAVRADAHAALTAKLTGTGQNTAAGEESNMLEFQLPGNLRVEYTVERDRVKRLAREGETTRQTEEYPLERSSGSWTIEQTPGGILVSLKLDRRLSPKRNSAHRAMKIEAILGLDHRLEAGAKP